MSEDLSPLTAAQRAELRRLAAEAASVVQRFEEYRGNLPPILLSAMRVVKGLAAAVPSRLDQIDAAEAGAAAMLEFCRWAEWCVAEELDSKTGGWRSVCPYCRAPKECGGH